MHLPAKIKESCLVQFDQVLNQLNVPVKVSFGLMQQIKSGYLPTSVLLNEIAGFGTVAYQYITLDELSQSTEDMLCIALSKNDEAFILQALGQGQWLIQLYQDVGQLIFSEQGTLLELKQKFKLLKTFIHLRKTKNIQKPKPSSYIFEHFWKNSSKIYSILGVSVAITLLGLSIPLGFQTFADKILPYSAINSLYVITLLLVLSSIASSVFQCFHDFQENVFLTKYENGLGKEVLSRLLAMDAQYFDQNKVGDHTKLVAQVEEVANFLVRQALSAVISVISLFVILPILFLYNFQLALLVLGIGLLMALTIGLSLKTLRQKVKIAYGYDVRFQSSLIEMFKGMRTIKSLATEPYFLNRGNLNLERNLYGRFNIAKFSNVIRAMVQFQSQLITVAVIFVGAKAVFANQMTIGELIAFNMLANNVINPLVSLVMAASGLENFKLAKQKLSALKPPVAPIISIAAEELDLDGDIQFEDVWFTYPRTADAVDKNQQPVLKGVSFRIKKGDVVGIVGGSGSGKSTLVNLLLGFYKPDRGKIKINGYDTSFISGEILRSRIASVQQTCFLFNATVLENIHIANLNAGFGNIQSALAQAEADQFVDEMPQKFMTVLAEDGGNLSGGQKQRLAIARALVRKANILLFDEATSALDNQTEEKIKDTIYSACEGKTSIIIAHRLNTLSNCSQLIVLNQGTVEAVGSHEELLKVENSYQKMLPQSLNKQQPMIAAPAELLTLRPTYAEQDLKIDIQIPSNYAIWVKTGMEFRGSSQGNSPEDHGYVIGTINFISDSSELVEGVRLYRMIGQISSKEMLRSGAVNTLLRPGSVLSIEIRAGERRLISYLFDPFIKHFRTSLSEPS